MRYTPGAKRLSALHLEQQKTKETIHLTKFGYEKLLKEQERLLAERPAAVDTLKRARELGDLSENGFYKASRAKLSQIDGRLFHLKMLLKTAEIIEQAGGDRVALGSTVTIANGPTEKVFMIVGRQEANPAQGRISDVSPIGQVLLGKKVGETVTINAPSGEIHYTIVKIAD
jgi:transcription elongation factor GreA